MSELGAIKFDSGHEKLPWDLLPYKATEGVLRVLLYGRRKYTICADCKARVIPNPRLDGDPDRDDCPQCGSTNLHYGAHNWRKGFKWTRLIAAAYRHLTAIAKGEDVDPESGERHVFHLACCVMFLAEHQIDNFGEDDRYSTKKV